VGVSSLKLSGERATMLVETAIGWRDRATVRELSGKECNACACALMMRPVLYCSVRKVYDRCYRALYDPLQGLKPDKKYERKTLVPVVTAARREEAHHRAEDQQQLAKKATTVRLRHAPLRSSSTLR
jgi:hypothetical protein